MLLAIFTWLVAHAADSRKTLVTTALCTTALQQNKLEIIPVLERIREFVIPEIGNAVAPAVGVGPLIPAVGGRDALPS